MQRATLSKSGSEAAPKLQGRIARAFSSNSLVNTMEMMATIQYILTAAQSLGSQDYYKKSRFKMLRLPGLLFCETSSHRQHELSYVLKKILTWMLSKARGGLKATVCNRVTTRLTLYYIVFCSFLFLSTSVLFCQHVLDIVGLSQAEI